MRATAQNLMRQRRRSRRRAAGWRQPKSSGCDWSCCAKRLKRPNHRDATVVGGRRSFPAWLIHGKGSGPIPARGIGGMRTRVLIVGGGPVGLTLAIDLAWRGADVVVAERRPTDDPPNV